MAMDADTITTAIVTTRRRLRCCCNNKDRFFAYAIGVVGAIGFVYTFFHDHTVHDKNTEVPFTDRNYHIEQKQVHIITADKNALDSVQLDRGGIDSSELGNAADTDEVRTNKTVEPSLTVRSCNHSTNSSVTKYDFVLSKSQLQTTFYRGRLVKSVSCKLLFDGDNNEIVDSSMYMSRVRQEGIKNDRYINMAKDCPKFKSERGYFDTAFTKTEENFPLAFSIVFYSGVEQVERLLRSIYRPQNLYCIHMDSKTLRDEKSVVSAIASCFTNVFIASRSVDIQWGKFSVLEAELICMQDLWAYPKWKYFINLTGQEFPLKTNLELVKILQAMQWANVVDGTWVRARANYFSRWTKSGLSPPHNIRPIKGSVHVAVNRDFVDFALHDYRSKDFLEWLNTTDIPDESFFSSLNHNPRLKIPGSFLGEAEEYAKKPTFTRYKNWEIGHGVWTRTCSGKFVRNICILGIGDLHRLKDDIGLFVNKFHLEYEHLALDCMEELMYNRTRDQYLNKEHIDVSYYAMLDQVKLRYVKPETKT